jgi:hypothetical protein
MRTERLRCHVGAGLARPFTSLFDSPKKQEMFRPCASLEPCCGPIFGHPGAALCEDGAYSMPPLGSFSPPSTDRPPLAADQEESPERVMTIR